MSLSSVNQCLFALACALLVAIGHKPQFKQSNYIKVNLLLAYVNLRSHSFTPFKLVESQKLELSACDA